MKFRWKNKIEIWISVECVLCFLKCKKQANYPSVENYDLNVLSFHSKSFCFISLFFFCFWRVNVMPLFLKVVSSSKHENENAKVFHTVCSIWCWWWCNKGISLRLLLFILVSWFSDVFISTTYLVWTVKHKVLLFSLFTGTALEFSIQCQNQKYSELIISS